MKNPLANVPLNTKRVYVMATTNAGCDIYMPVDSDDENKQIERRDELRKFLSAQDDNTPQTAA